MRMQPGKEMDEAVGRFCPWRIPVDDDRNPEKPILSIPPFSTDPDAAWTLIVMMWDKGWSVESQRRPWLNTGGVKVCFTRPFDEATGVADTFAHAVCIAALEALGVVIEDGGE